MFSLKEKVVHGFYKKVLYNMQSFWFGLDRNKILADINKWKAAFFNPLWYLRLENDLIYK